MKRPVPLPREHGSQAAPLRALLPLLPYVARYKGRLDGWHNATAVVVAVPAA